MAIVAGVDLGTLSVPIAPAFSISCFALGVPSWPVFITT
jgi:hypothetical protein